MNRLLPVLPAAALAFAVFSLTGCGAEGAGGPDASATAGLAAGVTVSETWARTPAGGRDITAGYMTLEAPGGDALVGAASESAERIELHTHINDNGVMRMRPVDRVELPAGEVVRFEPGGLHLMIFGLAPEAVEAGEIEVTLDFAGGEARDIVLEMRQR